jgi:apolipoprotein N-acyltransferase
VVLKYNQNRHVLLAILSGVLLWLAWPTKPLGFLLHIALVPILIIEAEISSKYFKRQGLRFFGLVYFALLIWNALSTWWIYNATAGGGIFAIAANALLMSIPLMLFYYTKKAGGAKAGYFSFIVYWIAFEYIHLNWTLTWPWLTLGNGFASMHYLVQWYEYTGHLGGTLWVLLGNIVLFHAIKTGRINTMGVITFSFLFIIPALFSVVRYFTYQEKGEKIEVIVVQPNIDPYEQKFEGTPNFIPYQHQIDRMITLSEKMISPETEFVFWPETALPFGYWEHEIDEYDEIEQLKVFVSRNPQITLVTGLDTYESYGEVALSPTARHSTSVGYYDVFNSAIKIDSGNTCSIYHKSKLVPGVEYIPPVIKNFAIDLGGSVGGLGCAPERSVFFNEKNMGVAPVICYESVFGEFVTEYIRKGADFIAIITNDGWWGNTPGHRQHLEYAKLRSIETRRDIARSANTGVSGFINQRGDIRQTTKYWEEAVVKDFVYLNKAETFYVKYGDYIGITCLYFSIICLVFMVVGVLIKRFNII